MLSNHRFGCLPQHRSPSTEPNSTLFRIQLSSMRQICPNRASFFFMSDDADDSLLFVQLLSDAVIGDFLTPSNVQQISVTPHFKSQVFFHLLATQSQMLS